MKRREILRYTALLTGASVIAPVAMTLSSCKTDANLGDTYTPQFFSAEDFDIVKKVVDLIIPKTDSPSASEVGVHKMIDDMAANVFPEDHKKEYTGSTERFLSALKQMDNLDSMALLGIEKRRDAGASGYRAIKQQTVAYYLNTEEVGTKFLNYLPVPGEYQGCIELSEVDGKAWAL